MDVLRQKDEIRRLLGNLPQEFGVYPRVAAVRHRPRPCLVIHA
jgi:hypothetical protein